jgi:cyclase
LIHTEGHHDHVAGDYFFEVPVVCHEKTRETILAADIPQLKAMIAGSDARENALMEDYHINLPAVIYSGRLTLKIGGHTFQVLHTPGHTAGQTSILIPEERVVFTGDNVCNGHPSFLHEALPQEWLESLRRIGAMDIDHIVPGHGEPCDRSYLGEMTRIIEDWFASVRQAVKEGWSKEESIQRIKPPPSTSTEHQDENFIKMMVGMNVSHLFDVFSAEKSGK